MEKTLFQKTYQLFLVMGFISLGLALLFSNSFSNSVFELSVSEVYFSTPTSRIWVLFAGYMFLLTFIYYIISRAKLKTKKWLVISHYTFIILFLVGFVIFSCITNQHIQSLFGGIPLITLISIYGIIFFIDAVLFILGILFLLINLFSLHRNKTK